MFRHCRPHINRREQYRLLPGTVFSFPQLLAETHSVAYEVGMISERNADRLSKSLCQFLSNKGVQEAAEVRSAPPLLTALHGWRDLRGPVTRMRA